MIISTTSLIICTILLTFSLLSSIINPFFRKIKTNNANDNTNRSNQLPEVSILITAHEITDRLHETLSQVLQQEYENDFEIIVVMEKGSIEAEAILSQYTNDKHIYTTFVPQRSLFMSKEKLAISLGVKASHHEWVILLPSDCVPISTKWLSTIARNFNDGTSLVMGYSNYESTASSYCRFERLRTSISLMKQATQRTAFRTNSPNIAFRKSMFIDANGYKGNLQFLHGEYDFIINKYAQKGNTAIEVSPESFIIESKPSKKEWLNAHLGYIHIKRHLLRSFTFRLKYAIELAMMYINYALILASAFYSSVTSNWLLLSTSIIALILTITLRTLLGSRAIRTFNEKIPYWKTVPFEMAIGFHNCIYYIRYIFSDKIDFTTHKL